MQRQAFRQWGMWMLAGCLGLVAAGVLAVSLAGWSPASAVRASWAVLAITGAYVVCVRPCLVVEEAGVTIRNIIRDVHIPWSAVDGTHVRWELVVDTPTGGYASWAISSSPGPSRDARPAAEVDGWRGPSAAIAGWVGVRSAVGPGPGWGGLSRAELAALESGVAGDAKATTIAAVIHHRLGHYLAQVERGSAPLTQGHPVVRVVWWAVALLVVPAVTAVLVTLLAG